MFRSFFLQRRWLPWSLIGSITMPRQERICAGELVVLDATSFDTDTLKHICDGGDCGKRMVRGGAYNSPSESLRVQKRDAYTATRGMRNIGFRIARDM